MKEKLLKELKEIEKLAFSLSENIKISSNQEYDALLITLAEYRRKAKDADNSELPSLNEQAQLLRENPLIKKATLLNEVMGFYKQMYSPVSYFDRNDDIDKIKKLYSQILSAENYQISSLHKELAEIKHAVLSNLLQALKKAAEKVKQQNEPTPGRLNPIKSIFLPSETKKIVTFLKEIEAFDSQLNRHQNQDNLAGDIINLIKGNTSFLGGEDILLRPSPPLKAEEDQGNNSRKKKKSQHKPKPRSNPSSHSKYSIKNSYFYSNTTAAENTPESSPAELLVSPIPLAEITPSQDEKIAKAMEIPAKNASKQVNPSSPELQKELVELQELYVLYEQTINGNNDDIDKKWRTLLTPPTLNTTVGDEVNQEILNSSLLNSVLNHPCVKNLYETNQALREEYRKIVNNHTEEIRKIDISGKSLEEILAEKIALIKSILEENKKEKVEKKSLGTIKNELLNNVADLHKAIAAAEQEAIKSCEENLQAKIDKLNTYVKEIQNPQRDYSTSVKIPANIAELENDLENFKRNNQKKQKIGLVEIDRQVLEKELANAKRNLEEQVKAVNKEFGKKITQLKEEIEETNKEIDALSIKIPKSIEGQLTEIEIKLNLRAFKEKAKANFNSSMDKAYGSPLDKLNKGGFAIINGHYATVYSALNSNELKSIEKNIKENKLKLIQDIEEIQKRVISKETQIIWNLINAIRTERDRIEKNDTKDPRLLIIHPLHDDLCTNLTKYLNLETSTDNFITESADTMKRNLTEEKLNTLSDAVRSPFANYFCRLIDSVIKWIEEKVKSSPTPYRSQFFTVDTEEKVSGAAQTAHKNLTELREALQKAAQQKPVEEKENSEIPFWLATNNFFT